MYLLELFYENARYNRTGSFSIPIRDGKIAKWTPLYEGRQSAELLKMIALALTGPKFLTAVSGDASKMIRANFNQTLDLRLIDKERASLLKRIRCENTKFSRSNYYFSLNDDKNLDLIEKKYRLLKFTPKDNVAFVCMYGFNTTLARDVRRFSFLKSLPGAYVFVQRYRPIPGGPEPNTDDFFDDNADELLDQLTGICFAQNMKSMETYYRWVGRLYAEKFGKPHMKLVDTLFRYNRRHMKGKYIESMTGTPKRPPDRRGKK